MPIEPPPLRVAIADGPDGAALDAAEAAIAAAIAAAAAQRAAVLLTHECALTGYPPAHGPWRASWCAVAEAEARLDLLAQRAGIALALGTASEVDGAVRNELWWCGAVAQRARYAKRTLTPADRAWFAAGTQPVVVEHAGWRLGLAICFDVRSASAWHALGRAGADAVLCAAHMAGADCDPGTKAEVVPAYFSVRAAELAAPVALANVRAADRWLTGGAWDARGCRLPVPEGIVSFRHRNAHDAWYGAVRSLVVDAERALPGVSLIH